MAGTAGTYGLSSLGVITAPQCRYAAPVITVWIVVSSRASKSEIARSIDVLLNDNGVNYG